MKTHYPKLLLYLLPVIFTPLVAQAQKEQEGEPFQIVQEFPFTHTVYLQDKHEIQQTVEVARNDQKALLVNSMGYEMEYGLTDWLQLSAGYYHGHVHRPRLNYSANWLEVGTTLGIEKSTHQAAAFMLEAEIPLKDKSVGEQGADDAISYSPTFLYAVALGKAQVHFNAGAELQPDEQEWFYNATVVYGFGHWHPLLEVNTFSEDKLKWYVGPGLVLNGNKGWEFIAGARRSLRDASWDLSLKLLYEFTPGGQ